MARTVTEQLPPDGEPARWYAFRTGFRREKRVDARLRDRGLEVYLPIRHVVRHYKSKTTTSLQPLFNSYIFAKITRGGYGQVLSDPDVYEIVRFNGEVGLVADKEIAFLRTVLGEDRDRYDARVREGLLIGDDVVITGGTLAGTRGRVVGDRANQTFLVELRTLGVSLEINVESRHLARDSSAGD